MSDTPHIAPAPATPLEFTIVVCKHRNGEPWPVASLDCHQDGTVFIRSEGRDVSGLIFGPMLAACKRVNAELSRVMLNQELMKADLLVKSTPETYFES